MKKVKLLIFIMAFSFSIILKGQDCSQFAFSKGASFEMEMYDKKNNKTASTKNVIKETTTKGLKKEAVIHTESYDDKNEKIAEADMKIICEGGKLFMDMSSLALNNPMANNPDMQMKIEGGLVEYPSNLSVGQTLANATMVMSLLDKKSNQEFANSKITMFNRKVEGKETLTTPAGTFECFKITYDIKVETSMMGGMKMPEQIMKEVNYISSELGLLIKGENLNQKGEVTSSQVLTKYSK